jgi:Spy/CpxP family protein refolding chaperone
VRLEKRIHEINERTVRELAARLPGGSARRLTDLFLMKAYPPVYPDPTDITMWFEKVAGVTGLTPDQRAAIDAFRTQADSRRNELCTSLVREYETYRDDWGSGRGDRFNEYAARANELHAERVATARNAMQQISAVLSAEQQMSVAEVTKSIESRLSRKFHADSSRTN